MKLRLKALIGITLLLVSDLLTKYLFYNQELRANFSFIQKSFNTGISRSLPVPELIIISIAVLALWVFIYMFLTKKISFRIFIFLVAGTLGNFVDRIAFHGVRDFIMAIPQFPIFNLADVYITIGALILVNTEILPWKYDEKK